MEYERGTVLKWTRNAMARSHALDPNDRMIWLGNGKCILYDYVTKEVRQTDMRVELITVQPDDLHIGRLTIDVKMMSNDPSIPALIEEFNMEEA